MTDLESPRKNNDCYFYYYSTCAKGDNCTFRHEPSALGCETMCSFWKEGKCLNVHCNFRHMELRKNRKAIPCYWESQPGGCLKPFCPFLHQTAKAQPADESLENKTDSGTESADNSVNEKLSHLSEKSFKNPPVDSLVVNFEEESDNESAPTNSPIKSSAKRVVKVKTLEEIKLERIQAESAAFYSYPETEKESRDADDLRQRIMGRLSSRKSDNTIKRKLELNNAPTLAKKQKTTDVSEIKIKTLEEIRAERAKKLGSTSPTICDSSVSSTQDIVQEKKSKSTKIKLQRRPVYEQQGHKSENVVEEENVSSDKQCDSDQDVEMKTENKTVDEVLLLQDDDDNSNVSIKDEERLLNDLDEFLED